VLSFILGMKIPLDRYVVAQRPSEHPGLYAHLLAGSSWPGRSSGPPRAGR